MKGDIYNGDLEYAESRLRGTIVMYNNLPVTVLGVEGGGNVVVRYLISGDSGEVKLEDLDLTPVSLGYVNTGSRASYVVRKPMRRDWRQGLRTSNIASTFGDSPQEFSIRKLGNTIIGQFPSIRNILREYGEDRSWCKAWHREWAINSSGHLLHKDGDVVGKIRNEHPILDEKHQYLEESLQEALAL